MTDELGYLESENLGRLSDLTREHPHLDVILLDLNISGANGLTSLADIQKFWQNTGVAVTASERQSDIDRALAAGAASFIPKTVSSDVMISALTWVAKCETYLPDSARIETSGPPSYKRATMTDRQMDILRLLAVGKTDRQIGSQLGIANTARVHLSAIFKNLGVKPSTESVFVDVRNGMVTIAT